MCMEDLQDVPRVYKGFENLPEPRILLHPQLPKPLHGLNPRSLLGQEWWNVTRYEAYAFYDYRCWACDTPRKRARYRKWLECHEWYEFDWENFRLIFQGCVALCHACHNAIHDGRMQNLMYQGRFSQQKYLDIVGRRDELLSSIGVSLLETARLREQPPGVEDPEVWKNWRLVMSPQHKYAPIHANEAAWRRYYGIEEI